MKGRHVVNAFWMIRAGLCFVSCLALGISASSSFVAGLHGSLLAAACGVALVGACQVYRREVRRRVLSDRLSRTVLRNAQRAAVRRSPHRGLATA